MNLSLWHLIVTTTMEVRLLLSEALPTRSSVDKAAQAAVTLTPAVRTRLRAELLDKLSALRAKLRGQLSDKETGMVLLPLVIHVDELVMLLMAPVEQAQWPLLQRELFDVHHGGEVFFEFIDERLNMPDTPQLVIHVLYFCLSDGFTGRFREEPARIEQYKRLLAERIPVPVIPSAAARRRRAKEDTEQAVVAPPAKARWFYLAAGLGVLVLMGLTVLFTNL